MANSFVFNFSSQVFAAFRSESHGILCVLYRIKTSTPIVVAKRQIEVQNNHGLDSLILLVPIKKVSDLFGHIFELTQAS